MGIMFHLDDCDRNMFNNISMNEASESSSIPWKYQISETAIHIW